MTKEYHALRRRMEILYMAATGASHPDGRRDSGGPGARQWLSEQLQTNVSNIGRWWSGERTPDRRSLRMIELMEQLTMLLKGQRAFSAAEKRHKAASRG